MARTWLLAVLAAGLLAPVAARSEQSGHPPIDRAADAPVDRVVHARIDRALDVYDVNRDLTYTRTQTDDVTLFTARALRDLSQASQTFYPDKQALTVVEAWVDEPDGTRVPVAKSSIFTRPSTASRSAPGFVDSLTTTVLFPRLVHGSRTHIVWRFVQKTPPLLGFNAYNINAFDWDTGRDETRINIPADVPLHWRARGGYVVTDHVDNGVRHVDAFIAGTRGRESEPAMVDTFDFMPLFLATSLPNARTIGAIIDKASRGRAAVTPEIAALAARVVGDRTGLAAARAIHAWVTRDIRYVAVYLTPDDGWVPHTAASVLKAGYGDCKDYVVLMRALLAARGIESRMALVSWGSRYADLPLWMPYYNHAILYLPAYDRYLNPTDRDAAFDALGRRLSGKQVVIVTRDGEVARTPPATPDANRYRYLARVTVEPNGTEDGTAEFEMSPNEEILARAWLTQVSSTRDMARRILSFTPEGGFGDYIASDPRDLATKLALRGHWRSAWAVNPQGRDVFSRVPGGLDLYSPSRERAKLSPDGRRRTPVMADVTDSIWKTTITPPPGMDVARLPPDVDVATGAGHYTARYDFDRVHDTITATRHLLISQQIVPPDQYPALERLIYASLVDTRAVIVLAPVVR
jgi:transglutaminase-like putative cysteine protease